MRTVALIAAALASASPAARAQDVVSTARPGRHGPALSLAGGYQAVDVGITVAYFLPRLGRFHVAPWMGFGAFTVPEKNVTGVNAGVSASFGWRHRLIVDLGGGTVAYETLHLHGAEVAARGLRGVAVGGGYEFLGEAGFLLRFMFGRALRLGEAAAPRSRDVATGTFSLGWKLW